MIPGIVPTCFDAIVTEQRYSNLTMGSAGKPAVERLQDHAQARPAGVGQEMLAKESPGRSELVEAFQRIQRGLRSAGAASISVSKCTGPDNEAP